MLKLLNSSMAQHTDQPESPSLHIRWHASPMRVTGYYRTHKMACPLMSKDFQAEIGSHFLQGGHMQPNGTMSAGRMYSTLDAANVVHQRNVLYGRCAAHEDHNLATSTAPPDSIGSRLRVPMAVLERTRTLSPLHNATSAGVVLARRFNTNSGIPRCSPIRITKDIFRLALIVDVAPYVRLWTAVKGRGLLQ